MPAIDIKDPHHTLFTSKMDPDGFIEQCRKIIAWRKNSLTPEQLLGIGDLASADAQTIKKSFKLLALRFHPDKAPNQKEAAEAFSVLQDALVYLLYQKGDFSKDAIKNNPFAPVQGSTHGANIFTDDFFENFFEDLFKDTDGFSEEQTKRIADIRTSMCSVKEAMRVIDSLKQALASFDLYDFSHEQSSKEVDFKKNELLDKVTKISRPYLDTLKKLDSNILHKDNKKERSTNLGMAIINNTKASLSVNAEWRSTNLKAKEAFLQDPHTRLQIHWNDIIKKTEELESKAKHDSAYKKAANTARTLVTSLNATRDILLQSKKTSFEYIEEFRKACLQSINTARPELIKHRGWKQLLADVTINLLIFVGTCSLSMVFTGKFRLFQPQTDSAEKLVALEESVKGMIHIPPEGRPRF